MAFLTDDEINDIFHLAEFGYWGPCYAFMTAISKRKNLPLTEILIGARNLRGDNALHRAVWSGKLSILHGACEQVFHDSPALRRTFLNAVNSMGDTAFNIAAANGNVEYMQALLTRGADLEVQNVFGWTALHWASAHSYESAAQLLVHRGINLDVQSESGDTALHLAVRVGTYDVVKYLVVKGANTTLRNVANMQPKDVAVAAYRPAIAEYLGIPDL